ncbi:substrate-binding periplasmic protein [Marinomonas sp. PE14-40]|uniref:substrate-binding periplasmic protein n=1 Tax=Marinomonas sp. PE14-40 TaxID=3060621 RepID=UPI003F672CB0
MASSKASLAIELTKNLKRLASLNARCIVASLLLVLINPAFAKYKTIKIVTLFDYAPYCMADEGYQSDQLIHLGEDAIGFRGYSWDVLRESFQEMGYTIQLKIVPWARAVSTIRSGNADILFPTGINTERLSTFYFSEEAINSAKFKVYVNQDSALEWQDLTSLKGLSIGVKRGFNYGDKWDAVKDINIIKITTITQGFKMLEANYLDGFLGYETNWDYTLKQENWQGKFKKMPAFDSSNEYLAALKTNPNAKALLADFDLGKRRLMKQGRLQQIHEKWFGKAE